MKVDKRLLNWLKKTTWCLGEKVHGLNVYYRQTLTGALLLDTDIDGVDVLYNKGVAAGLDRVLSESREFFMCTCKLFKDIYNACRYLYELSDRDAFIRVRLKGVKTVHTGSGLIIDIIKDGDEKISLSKDVICYRDYEVVIYYNLLDFFKYVNNGTEVVVWLDERDKIMSINDYGGEWVYVICPLSEP